MLGNYDSLWEAQSVRDELRVRRGGGIASTLLIYALEKGIIKNALVIKSSSKEPWAEPTITTTPEEILSAAGSKYVFVPFGKFTKGLGKDSAVVGLPCQIKACAERDFLKIGLFDGMPITSTGIRYLLRQLKIDSRQIKNLDYRAPEKGLKVELENGTVIRYGGYFWLAYFFCYSQCVRCGDNTNHYADVSIGDRRLEWSTVVVRTERGKELFQKALKDGYIRAKQIPLDNLLAKVQSPLYWKEVRGGYIHTKLVRPRGYWFKFIPLPIVKYIGRKIYLQTLKMK
jgi:coenzyme F420 hydrogenase subunit beta